MIQLEESAELQNRRGRASSGGSNLSDRLCKMKAVRILDGSHTKALYTTNHIHSHIYLF